MKELDHFKKKLDGTFLSDAEMDDILFEFSRFNRMISGICHDNDLQFTEKIKAIIDITDFANDVLKDKDFYPRYEKAMERKRNKNE